MCAGVGCCTSARIYGYRTDSACAHTLGIRRRVQQCETLRCFRWARAMGVFTVLYVIGFPLPRIHISRYRANPRCNSFVRRHRCKAALPAPMQTLPFQPSFLPPSLHHERRTIIVMIQLTYLPPRSAHTYGPIQKCSSYRSFAAIRASQPHPISSAIHPTRHQHRRPSIFLLEPVPEILFDFFFFFFFS